MLKTYCVKDLLEVGMDEAGRGPMFGRVYVAGVIIPPDETFSQEFIKDSKKLGMRKRLMAFDFVKENAIDWAVEYKDEKYIDKHNIYVANYNAMHDALNQLLVEPEHILVDGNYFKPYCAPSGKFINHTTVVKGDNEYASIAAASILAKVSRDKYVEEMCDKYPELDEYYGLRSNKGYASRQHLDGIRKHGCTKFHRKSFGLCKTSKEIVLDGI